MNTESEKERRIIKDLMTHVSSLDDIGLLNGKMGIALYFFYLARHSDNDVYEQFASDLFDEVFESVSQNIFPNFDTGITGIGWAVEYLIQNRFIAGDSDDILEEADSKVELFFIYGDGTLDTISSIAYYYIARLNYRIEDETTYAVLSIKHKVILLIDMLEQLIIANGGSEEIAYLLDELHKLNIFNYKIEKLKQFIGPYEYGFLIPRMKKMQLSEIEAKLRSADTNSIYAGFDMDSVPENERWGLKNGICGIGFSKLLLNCI